MSPSIALNLYQFLHGAKSDVRWIEQVYPSSLWVLIFAPFIVVLLYYFLIVIIGPAFRKLLAWLGFMIGTSIITGLITYFMARHYLKDTPFSSEFVSFGFINLLYALILFFLLSFFFKRFSTHAPRTPF